MPLFVCEKCFCVENTALGRYWTKDSERLWGDDNRGKALCSECEPTHYKDGSVNGDGGKWHGKFEKFYPSLEEIQGGRMHDFINRDTVLKLLEERDRGYQRLSEAIRDSLAPSDII